jgi:hypothetical protein
VWAEREGGREGWAEGANETGEVGEQGARLKRGAGARTWPENARSWARPRWGDRGREVEDELTGGDGGTERKWAWGKKERRRQLWPTGQRDRGGERARWRDRLTGMVCLSARGRAQAGPTWANWARLAFSISTEFLFAFLFIFSRVLNSNSNQVSNSNEIKYMQQFKEYLDSI